MRSYKRQLRPGTFRLHIHDALWNTMAAYFVVTQVMWVFRFAGGYNNPLCLIIQSIVWGGAGPEVTAAPSVKQLWADINMQMKDANRWFTHRLWKSVSSFFFQLRELTIIGRSSIYNACRTWWQWTGGVGALNSQQRSNWELKMQVTEPNRISLGRDNLQVHMSVFNYALFLKCIFLVAVILKVPLVSNIKHCWFEWFFFLIFCTSQSVSHIYQQTKAFPQRTVSISHFIDFRSLIEPVCCCIHQLRMFKTKVFAVVSLMDRKPKLRQSRGEENAQWHEEEEKPTLLLKVFKYNDYPPVSIETNMDSHRDDGRWWSCLYQYTGNTSVSEQSI